MNERSSSSAAQRPRATPHDSTQDVAVSALREALGVPVDHNTLHRALVHRSWAFENDGADHNERLEFLGDSVLGLAVTYELYSTFPEAAEGELAKLRAAVVNSHALAHVARELGLGRALALGKGERTTGGRDKDSILADAMEAVIGAIYVSCGFDVARDFVLNHFRSLIGAAQTADFNADWKTSLQELASRKHMDPPRYDVTHTGPDHARHFVAHAMVNGTCWGTGEGTSKKIAEQHAAAEAVKVLKATRVPRKDTAV